MFGHGPPVDRAGDAVAGDAAAGFFPVRSERQLMEQIDYNLLFRWFVRLPMDAAVWHPTVFTQQPEPVDGGGCGAAIPGCADEPAVGERASVQ
jgi:hypothetical protein